MTSDVGSVTVEDQDMGHGVALTATPDGLRVRGWFDEVAYLGDWVVPWDEVERKLRRPTRSDNQEQP